MYQNPLIRILYSTVIAFLLGVSSLNTLAAGQGVPAVMGELQSLQTQVASLQQTVNDLTGYIESETVGTGDAYAEICFNARLGVLANGSVAVEGVNATGIGTGVDLYGLLDINAGIGSEGQAKLVAMLESGVDMTVKMCLNAGVTKVVGVDRARLPVAAPAGLNELLDSTSGVLTSVYSEFPAIVTMLPAGPENIDSGVNALVAATSSASDFSTTTLLNVNGWSAAVAGLPGAEVLEDRYSGIESTFATLDGGDVCGYYAGLMPTLDLSLANSISNTCSAVPAGIDTSIAAVSSSVDALYATTLFTIPNIESIVTTNYNFLTGTTMPVLNSINNKVDSIDDTVDDIYGALP